MDLNKYLNPYFILKKRDMIIPVLRANVYNPLAAYITSINYWSRFYLSQKNIFLSQNDKILSSLKNKHKGERCFIIGNGPSLLISDLSKMAENKDITIASNKIYLAFNDTKWRPTYYTVGDLLVAENNASVIRELDLIKIFPNFLKQIIGIHQGTGCKGQHLYFNDIKPIVYNQNDYKPRFSSEALKGFHVGETITNLNLQIAFYLGCNPIYIIGIDGSYQSSPSTTSHYEYGEVYVNRGEENHFHKDYRKNGETWSIPKPKFHEICYQFSRKIIESRNVEVFNASRESYVKAFKRIDLDSIL